MNVIDINSEQWSLLQRSGVYACYRNSQMIYVGSSRSVLRRVLDKTHHLHRVLKRKGVSLRIYPCKNYDDAMDLERKFLERYQPCHNRRLTH